MSKKLLIDARLADETRIVILNKDTIEDVDYESTHRKPTKGNIYLTKVTRVEPSLQACFVEYGGNRQGFLAFNEIHPDYYRIPVEDRQRLLEEEKQKALAIAKAEADSDSDANASTDTNANADSNSNGDEANSSDARLESIADIASDDSRPRHRFEKFRRQYSIQEVISRNQIMLVQVAKEERGNKGAAMTTYLSLAGRYSVLMPNTYHSGGISRKISDSKDRKKLKSIISSLTIPHGMAVIARTAGSGRTKTEFTRDYNRLLKEWEEVRELTLKSSAPSLIYEGANLIKRAVRDYYAPDVGEIIVQGEAGYKAARTHMKHLSPTHVKKVKEYKNAKNADQPLFQHYNVEKMLAAMHDPRVGLKSGGSLVINQTEALVAIDVNSGKATAQRSIEETAFKTNLEAANEIARQLKQRDLSGLIVIDFIDMEIDRNKHAVVNALRDAMRADKARAQVGNISQFGLLEMSRQRLRPSLSEAMSDVCPRCHGTGRVRAKEIEAVALLDRIEEEARRQQNTAQNTALGVGVTFDMAEYLSSHRQRVLDDLKTRYGTSITLNRDESLLASQIRFEYDDGASLLVDTASGSEEAKAKPSTRPTAKSSTRPSTRGKARETNSRAAVGEDARDGNADANTDANTIGGVAGGDTQANQSNTRSRSRTRKVMPPFARRGRGRGRRPQQDTSPDLPPIVPNMPNMSNVPNTPNMPNMATDGGGGAIDSGASGGVDNAGSAGGGVSARDTNAGGDLSPASPPATPADSPPAPSPSPTPAPPASEGEAEVRAGTSSAEINVTMVGKSAARTKKTGHWSR